MHRHSLIVHALFMASSPTWAMVDPPTIIDVSGGASFIYNGSFTAPNTSSSAPNDVPLFSIQVPFSGSFVLTGVPVGSVKDLTLQLRNGGTNPNISPPGTVPGTTLEFSNIFNAGSATSPYGIRVRYNSGFSGDWTGTLNIAPVPLPSAAVLMLTALAVFGLLCASRAKSSRFVAISATNSALSGV